MKRNTQSTGRLKQSLSPVAHTIVFPPKPESILLRELTSLATLNEAHLISLFKTKLLPFDTVKKLLISISYLRKKNFSTLLGKSAERGSYLLFENYLIDALGMQIAGSLHIGRSRNDINATLFKLNLRSCYRNIYNNLRNLRATLLQKAHQYLNVAMPIYSQFQVAQVGTYAYYLLAIEEALAREQHFLKDLIVSFEECPLGAAAGCGTSFPIDTKLTASLLGFSRCCNNALDAVANRDLALRMLSIAATIGTTLSRIAQDYQLWTTQEFAFFELSDNLCGGSSMMPQKKNPYLLEIIKGKSASVNGMLVQALTAMHNVLFGNSVEVGTEATQGIETALTNIADVLTLAALLIDNALPIESNLNHSINKGVAIAAGVAELLVKEKNLPFRQAHYEIGEKITQSISKQVDPKEEILKLVGGIFKTQGALFWAGINEYGGGPGKHTTKKASQNAQRRLNKDTVWIEAVEKRWTSAEMKLQQEIKKVCAQNER